MDLMIAFLQSHMNWGAFPVILMFVAIFFWSRGAAAISTAFALAAAGFLGFVYYKVNEDPEFLAKWKEEMDSVDVEGAVMGNDDVRRMIEESEKRMQEESMEHGGTGKSIY